MQRVFEVTAADISLIKTKPPQIYIAAHGTVPTSGWKNPELSPWFYINPPDDGILDFDFGADAPSGIVLQMLTPIAAELTIPRDPADFWGPGRALQGVRIHARSNFKEAKFGASVLFSDAAALGGDAVPWPWQLPTKQPTADNLIGKSLRVYHTGDGLTLDYWPDRANIELSPSTKLIVRVWFG